MESFDETALLAELEDDQEGTQHAEREESHEELERRLMREIADMPDQMALEEAALMRDLASMKEEPDEGEVLMAALLAEEETERRAKEAKARTRASAPASAAPKVPDASENAALRDACLQEKREAVRLKRAGDIDGAKAALRRAKDIAARADAAEATTTTTTTAAARASTPNAAPTSSAETIEELTRAVDAARRDAVARKRAGDMAAARAALTESKELRAKLEAAVAAAEAAKNADSEPTEAGEETPEPNDVDAMIAEAIGTVVKIISDDPDSKVTARKKKSRDDDDEDEGGDEGDDALLRRELGDDYEAQREHWGGDYRHPEPTSERELIASRVEELERLVDSEKRTALARKRGGDHEGARNALRAMKAAQAELADASAMLAALED